MNLRLPNKNVREPDKTQRRLLTGATAAPDAGVKPRRD